MVQKHSRVYAKIDLSAVVHNIEEIHKLVQPSAQIIAVVKTDGYGHGAPEVAGAIEHFGYLFGFAVATAQEAYELRRHGIQKPVLVLGHVFEEHYPMLVQYGIRPAIFTLEAAKQLSKAAQEADKDIAVHIKIDTGMGRIGMPPGRESVKLIAQISALPHIVIEGIFTHFARADETDKTAAKKQLEQFEGMLTLVAEAGISIPYRHCSNSAAILDLPFAGMDLVRAGIILYGLWPSNEVQKSRINLRPVLELKSHIAYIKEAAPGQCISYGGTYTVMEPKKIATIPVGYGDGYPRSLSNKGWVLVHGQKASIVGRVCMDQFMVDVTGIPNAAIGDTATLVGTDGAQCITMEELGALSGRFHYEFACCLGSRIPRVFYKDGIPVSERECF